MTSCLVCELKAKGQDEGEDTLDKRLAVVKERKIGRLVLKINGDSPVFAGLAGLFLHGSPSGHQVCAVYDTTWGNPSQFQEHGEGRRLATTKSDGVWDFS